MDNFAALVNLAKDSSESSRVELSKKTSLEFLESSKEFSQHEYELFGSIIEMLYIFIPQEIKQQLTTTMAIDKGAPQSILRTIALDNIDFAAPILNYSEVLSEKTILEVIAKKSDSHRILVANRTEINEEITNALIETKSLNVIVAVGKNLTAKISNAGYQAAIDITKDVQDAISIFGMRKDIPLDLVEVIYQNSNKEAKNEINSYRAANNNSGNTTIDECLKLLFSGQKDNFLKSIAKAFNISVDRLRASLDNGDLNSFMTLARACDLDAKSVERFRNIYLNYNVTISPEQTREIFVFWIKNSVKSSTAELLKKFPIT